MDISEGHRIYCCIYTVILLSCPYNVSIIVFILLHVLDVSLFFSVDTGLLLTNGKCRVILFVGGRWTRQRAYGSNRRHGQGVQSGRRCPEVSHARAQNLSIGPWAYTVQWVFWHPAGCECGINGLNFLNLKKIPPIFSVLCPTRCFLHSISLYSDTFRPF